MPETDKPLAFFHDEPIRDTDLTFSEAVTEARRCLNCRVPQCRKGCPIENEIPQFIHELTTGNLGAAAAHIYHRSDLPALCGRICPREAQCEGACILNKKGQPVQIGKLERFVADAAMDAGLLPQKASKKSNGRIAVIGSGPAGLAAARMLAQKDYDVTVFEAASQPGGTMTYGIPTFRLHKELILREVAALERLGVSFQYGKKLGEKEDLALLFQEGYEAVFIAVGTMECWKLDIENDQLDGVIDAAQFLRQVEQVQLGEFALQDLPVQAGDRVVVVGAGNVAIDAARTAQRLQADVQVVYRRGPKNMKCLPSEYEEAKEDGVTFRFYAAPRAVVGTDHVEGLQYEEQEVLEDATMVPTGKFGTVQADKIIAAIGNKPETSVIRHFGVDTDRDGYIVTAERPYSMTSMAGVFAAGDIVHKPQTVVLAMREGRKVADSIDAYIQAKRLLSGISQ